MTNEFTFRKVNLYIKAWEYGVKIILC
ncbi:MAG: hypothetical protein ACLRQF_17505 [Thomasclavelia ramosa]